MNRGKIETGINKTSHNQSGLCRILLVVPRYCTLNTGLSDMFLGFWLICTQKKTPELSNLSKSRKENNRDMQIRTLLSSYWESHKKGSTEDKNKDTACMLNWIMSRNSSFLWSMPCCSFQLDRLTFYLHCGNRARIYRTQPYRVTQFRCALYIAFHSVYVIRA